jgi:hypothetical protein
MGLVYSPFKEIRQEGAGELAELLVLSSQRSGRAFNKN